MIDYGRIGDVAEVTLNHPAKLNALTEGALQELDQTLRDAAADGARALILRGEGRAFCAGRDISAVDPAADDAEGYLAGLVTPVLRRLAEFPAPTYGVGHGAILGVGLGLLIACDVVYVADDARIGSPFGAIGALLDSGGHHLFTERLGAHRALELAYSGDMMSGADAVAAGLFARSLPAGEVLDFTRAMAARVAAGPTGAFLASRRQVALLRDARAGLWDSMAAEAKAQGELAGTDDYLEGFRAFQEKRAPVFRR